MKERNERGQLTREALAAGCRDRRLDLYGGSNGMYELSFDGHYDVELELWQESPGVAGFHVRATNAVSGRRVFWVAFTSLQEARKAYYGRAADVILQLQNGNFSGNIIDSLNFAKSEIPTCA